MHPTLSVCSRWSQTAPPKGELIALPEAFSIHPICFGYRKKAPPSGELSPKVTERVQLSPRAAAFPVWKTAFFPAFSTQKNSSGPVLKTWGPAIPDWRKINRRSGTVCRMQRKSFDFLFYKRQNACIFIQNFPESGCLNYGAYRADPLLLLKTQWKKWKTSRKTRPFLHKSG